MNPTVLITGASQGLGYAFAKIFAKNKYNLVFVARNKEKLTEIKEEIEKAHHNVVTIIVKDLSLPHASEEIYHVLQSVNIAIDVLVNNAGFATHGPFLETSLQDELEEIQINITTLTSLTRLIAKDMVIKRKGKILNIASTAAFQPGPFMAVYYATKTYVLSFSQALSEEFRGTGVTVTALCPGPTNTGFAKRAGLLDAKLFKKTADADTVASIGYHALMKGKRVVVPGLKNQIGTALVKFVPTTILLRMLHSLQE